MFPSLLFVDFSDSISKGRRTGYNVSKTEYELVGVNRLSTLNSTYLRSHGKVFQQCVDSRWFSLCTDRFSSALTLAAIV